MPSSQPDHSTLRVVFGGTPDFAAYHLQALIDNGCNIVGVYTQPDRPAGRGKKLTASPVKDIATAQDLPLFQPETLKTDAARETLRQLEPDVFVVVAYGLIVPADVLEIPRYGCINVHASLLPRWRGAAPIQRAIEAGDSHTGVTIMQMDAGLDTGDMLLKAECEIGDSDTAGTLHDKLARLGAPALLETLNAMARGDLHPERQDDRLSTYAPKITKQEARIDWSAPAQFIDRRIRAFNPFPVTFTTLHGEPLRIWVARVVSVAGDPGRVLATAETGVTVGCGQGALCITEAQLPGKRRMAIADILRGNPDLFSVGEYLDP